MCFFWMLIPLWAGLLWYHCSIFVAAGCIGAFLLCSPEVSDKRTSEEIIEIKLLVLTLIFPVGGAIIFFFSGLLISLEYIAGLTGFCLLCKHFCSLFGHRWHDCVCTRCSMNRDSFHRWDGCICETCKQHRDEGHRWDGCICDGCVCHRCNKSRHEFADGFCIRCGTCEVCAGKGRVPCPSCNSDGLVFEAWEIIPYGGYCEQGCSPMDPRTQHRDEGGWFVVCSQCGGSHDRPCPMCNEHGNRGGKAVVTESDESSR